MVTQETLAEPAPPLRPMAPQGVKAALLVPLTGQAAPVGQALFSAAQMALFDIGATTFSLQPFDTHGTPEGAMRAAQLATTQGSDLILGPLFSADVKAAAQVARQARINMVSFTTDPTAAGNGVYILGFLPRSQVARVVGQARAQGMTRFAVLAPDDDYGRTMANTFHDVVTASGGGVTRAEFYDARSGNTNSADAIRRLTAGGPLPFEALFLPDGGMRLRALAALLPGNGIDTGRIQLLGTMLWDEPTLGNEPVLQGGWYPAPPQAAHQDFVQSYQQAFGQKPPAIASLGYDATALAAVLAQRPVPDFGVASLTQPGGFAGVDGIFRLLADGTNQRGLALMQVTPTGPREISPAPGDFNGPAY